MSKAEDPLINCPLEKAHRVRKSRIQFHLMKCLKNHDLNTSHKIRCPFNPLHIVEAMEITHHCELCPDTDSIILEGYEIDGEKSYSGIISFDAHQKQYYENASKNNDWDVQNSSNRTAYDPVANVENEQIFHSLICESKSKKKAFKHQQRQRFADIYSKIINTEPSPKTPTKVYNLPRHPYSSSKSETSTSVKSEPANSVTTSEQTSADMKNSISKSSSSKEKQSCDENKLTYTKDDSKQISNVLDDLNFESMTDALNQLQILEKMESAVKERKNLLINMIASTTSTVTPTNSISCMDAIKTKSTVVKSDIDN